MSSPSLPQSMESSLDFDDLPPTPRVVYDKPPMSSLIRRQLHWERQGHDEDKSQAPECNEPPVVWAAAVFDGDPARPSTRNRGMPSAIYYDDRPLELDSTDEGTRRRPLAASAEAILDLSVGKNDMTWEGRVFEVVTQVVAYFPRSLTVATNDHGSRRRGQNLLFPNAARVPSQMDFLDFLPGTRRGINVKSPSLYFGIDQLVGYYPSFRQMIPGPDLLNISHKSAKDVRGDFTIFEPYGVLMHHFSQIEAIANDIVPSYGDKVDQSKPPDNVQTVENQVTQLQRKHFRHLYSFLRPIYESSVLPCQKLLQQSSPSIAFEMLWFIFRPGTDVYRKTPQGTETYVVAGIKSNFDGAGPSKVQHIPTELKFWVLELWYLTSDGRNVGRVKVSAKISAYAGLREITKLPLCPVSIWDDFDGGERRRKIMKRSRFLSQSLQQGHLFMRYDGPINNGERYYSGSVVVDCRRGQLQFGIPVLGNVQDHSTDFEEYDNILVNDGEDLGGETWNTDPFVMEPMHGARRPQAFHNRHPQPGPPPQHGMYGGHAPNGDFNFEAIIEDENTRAAARKDLNDHQLFLLSPQAPAFALKTKQWFNIWTDFLHETSPSEESLQKLVLGKDESETVRYVSKQQNSTQDAWAADFIKGKGKGQVILLHGPPGVGKTYTVEAIAEWLHRPLLALTIADIGTVETRIEQELIKWFALAEAWNAVLLVDEADIFLERRHNRDLRRNGLVSAFLRRMEYFSGLLFLTTNRVGHIDDAFISRVHVAIGYKALSGSDRQRIWSGFFDKLAKERADKIQIAPEAKNWVLETAATEQAQLNGRDIRNALQTAITLAEAEREEKADFDPPPSASKKAAIVVDRSHFQRVLDITNEFQEYVKSIRREDEKKRAKGRRDRNDYWEGGDDQLELIGHDQYSDYSDAL